MATSGPRRLGASFDADVQRPYGFVFELVAGRDGGVTLRFLAFGDRHPAPTTRSVYERAHKRLHGRYPDQ